MHAMYIYIYNAGEVWVKFKINKFMHKVVEPQELR